MLISQMIKGCKEKFFINQIFSTKIYLYGHLIYIFVENLVNKKLLLAAFYNLTYQIVIYIPRLQHILLLNSMRL